MTRLWGGLWVWYHRVRIERLQRRVDHHEQRATFHGRLHERWPA